MKRLVSHNEFQPLTVHSLASRALQINTDYKIDKVVEGKPHYDSCRVITVQYLVPEDRSNEACGFNI